MKKTLLIAALACSAFALPAGAGERGFYIGGRAGLNFAEDLNFDYTDGAVRIIDWSQETGTDVAGQVGIKTALARLEFEVEYQNNGSDDISATVSGLPVTVTTGGDFYTLSFLLNAYYDLDTKTPWMPYIGAGIGFANVGYDSITVAGVSMPDDDDTVWAWKLAAGLGYRINPNFIVDLGYRFFDTGDIDIGSGGSVNMTSHAMTVGARYHF